MPNRTFFAVRSMGAPYCKKAPRFSLCGASGANTAIVRPMRHTIFLVFLTSILSASVSAQVSGTVVDDDTDELITGAVVSVQASNVETTTNEEGAFELTDASGEGLLIVAGAKGYFYASSTESAPASDVQLRLEPVPQDDDPYYTFATPERCGECHPDQYEEWLGSPMQKAGMNTWVYDIYDGTGTGTQGLPGFIYTRDSVFKDSNPGSECASCHQPEPWAREAQELCAVPGECPPLGDREQPHIRHASTVSRATCATASPTSTSKTGRTSPGSSPAWSL